PLQEDAPDPASLPAPPPRRRASRRAQIDPRRAPESPPAPQRVPFHPGVVDEKRAHAKEASRHATRLSAESNPPRGRRPEEWRAGRARSRPATDAARTARQHRRLALPANAP